MAPSATVKGEIDSGLVCEIWLREKRLRGGDTLTVHCSIRNVSATDIALYRHLSLGPHLNLYLVTPEGRSLSLFNLSATVAPPSVDDFIRLPPGFMWGRTVDIPIQDLVRAWRGKGGRSLALGAEIDYTADGRPYWERSAKELFGEFRYGHYLIHARLSLAPKYRGLDVGLDAWTGDAKSLELGFDIVEGD